MRDGWLMDGPQMAASWAADGCLLGRRWLLAGPQMVDGWAWLADGCRLLLAGAADRVGLLAAKAAALSLSGPRCLSSPLRWVIRVRAAALPSQDTRLHPKPGCGLDRHEPCASQHC